MPPKRYNTPARPVFIIPIEIGYFHWQYFHRQFFSSLTCVHIRGVKQNMAHLYFENHATFSGLILPIF